MSDLKIKLDEIDFQFIGAEVLNLCPQNKGLHFTDGYLFYVQEFFDSLSLLAPFFQIRDKYSDLPLDFFINEPLDNLEKETNNLSNAQKREFLEGFNLGMDNSCKAIQLALSSALVKSVA